MSASAQSVQGTVWLDFDGTLVSRPAMWAEACLDALDELYPGHGLDHATVNDALSSGMPWQTHEPHTHLATPDSWWTAVAGRASEAIGDLLRRPISTDLADVVRSSITDPGRYRLFDDVDEALTLFTDRGWRCAVVSNHIPELEAVIRGLGLGHHFDWVVTSGLVGFEKPHPGIYEEALRRTSVFPVWMIGDNPEADCLPPVEQFGLQAVLVRSSRGFRPACDTLLEAAHLICP